MSESALYREFLRQDPGAVAAMTGLAQALLAEGDHEGALVQASTALARDPSLVPAWLVRATARQSLADFAGAAADLERADQLAPGRASILVNLANAYVQADRLADAERCFRRAAAAEPGCPEAHSGLGSVLVRLGRLAEAEAPCRVALAGAATQLAAHQNLSAILAVRDPAAARAHRDAAYRRQHIFLDPASNPDLTLLVLSAADAANIPLRHLLPPRLTVIRWYLEYATDADTIPPFDLIFNAIAEPDLAPPIPPAARRILHGRPVLNPPERVALTARAQLPVLLAGIADCVVPSSRPARPEILAVPTLFRPKGSHGGEGVTLLDPGAPVPDAAGTLTDFVDFRAPDGLWRKYRAIFIAGQVYPYHLAIGPGWLVHYWTAGMDAHAERRAEEQAFLASPEAAIGPRAMAALAEIGARLGLDYAGIDFSILRDGRVLVFEANASMLVHPEHTGPFTYRNPYVAEIQQAFAAMLSGRRAEHRASVFPALTA